MIQPLSREKNADKDMLFFCRKVRGRAAFLSVEERLKSSEKPDEETLNLIELALDDLNYCSAFLSENEFKDGDQRLKVYRVAHDQVRATLTKAEVELKLAKLSDAEQHLNDVREMIGFMKAGVRAWKLSTAPRSA